jgi:hypothetical protein
LEFLILRAELEVCSESHQCINFQQVESDTKGSSSLKEAYSVQEEIEVNHLPSAAPNAEFVDFKDITTRQQHYMQETYKWRSSFGSEFHAADINPMGSSKRICNVAKTSKPLNIGLRGGSSFIKLMHIIENFWKPSAVDERKIEMQGQHQIWKSS